MSDTSEPKWERVEPPNFDDDDLPKKDKLPVFHKPEELDPNSELVKEEVRHLFKMERQLAELLKALPSKFVHDQGNLSYYNTSGPAEHLKVSSKLEPFSGIGTATTEFSHLADGFHNNLDFTTPYELDIRLHTDDATMEQARQIGGG